MILRLDLLFSGFCTPFCYSWVLEVAEGGGGGEEVKCDLKSFMS